MLPTIVGIHTANSHHRQVGPNLGVNLEKVQEIQSKGLLHETKGFIHGYLNASLGYKNTNSSDATN